MRLVARGSVTYGDIEARRNEGAEMWRSMLRPYGGGLSAPSHVGERLMRIELGVG
jgi:hypothetical protein